MEDVQDAFQPTFGGPNRHVYMRHCPQVPGEGVQWTFPHDKAASTIPRRHNLAIFRRGGLVGKPSSAEPTDVLGGRGGGGCPQRITLVGRGRVSAPTQVFKQVLAAVDPVFAAQIGTSSAGTWNGVTGGGLWRVPGSFPVDPTVRVHLNCADVRLPILHSLPVPEGAIFNWSSSCHFLRAVQ